MKFPVPVLLVAALSLAVPAIASARPDDHGRGGGGAVRQGGGWRGGEGRSAPSYGRGAPQAAPYSRGEPPVGNYGRYYRPAPMNVVPPPDSRYGRRYSGDDGGYYPEPAPRRPANSLREGYHDQQDEAREGVRNGELMSPREIIPQLRLRQPGRILDAGIEEGPDGRTVYRIRWAAENGQRMDFIVDARTGAVLGTEGQ